MRRLLSCIICVVIVLLLCSCEGTSFSDKKYSEISDYVLENRESLTPTIDLEFFNYKATGLSIGGVYYGYYYTEDNEIAVPDYYRGNNLGEKFEEDGGIYFGKPNNGTDWCFIKKITDNWFYYELHWA